jgi:hypothetical protein
MFCPDCGAEVAEGRKFCGKCGATLRAAAVGDVTATQGALDIPVEAIAPAPAQPASPRRKLVYALVALLAILGGVGWWWFNRPAPAYKVQDPGIYPFQDVGADGTTQKWGFIDADGKVIVQPAWDGIGWGAVLGQPVVCNEGLCGVQKDSKWGYVDTTGKLAIPNQFDSVGPFVEGLARVNLGNQVGFIDKTGKYVINPQFSQVGDFHDGLAAVLEDGGWGFINKAGMVVIKPHFQPADVNGFSDGLAGACLNGKCGYIDHNGLFTIKPQFNSVNVFSEGLAAIQINGKWGYVNTAGNIAINPQFDSAELFSGGLAVVSVSGQLGTIDEQGKYAVNPGHYLMQPKAFDLLQVSMDSGVGLITKDEFTLAGQRGPEAAKWVVNPSKALTNVGVIFGKVFLGAIGGQMVPISISGKVLAGPYKGAMLDSLAQDIQNESSALQSMIGLTGAETNYSAAYPAIGFTDFLKRLGPAEGTPDSNHAGFIDATLATGTENGYFFVASIPAGTATGGTNFNYFIVAKPAAGHAGRIYCADSSGSVHSALQGEECTVASPTAWSPQQDIGNDIPQTPTNSTAPDNQSATVIDPPSNVRVAPSAASGILCSVTSKGYAVRILGSVGDWYKTDVCNGTVGYIHRSQIKF